MTREEKAVYYKHNGFNCCQSVIKAMIDLSNSDKEILMNAASGLSAAGGGDFYYSDTPEIDSWMWRAVIVWEIS